MTQPPQEKKPEQEYLEIEDSVHAEALFNKFDSLKKLYAALKSEQDKVKALEEINMQSFLNDKTPQLEFENQQLREKLEAAEKVAQAQAEKLHIFQCAIDEVFNNKHLRNNSLLTSNPPQNGGVWDLRNAVTQLLKASKG